MARSPSADFPTLWKVVDRLDQASIPYMLTGSMALNFYGAVRATNDVDIIVQIKSVDATKVYRLFEKDFYVSEATIREAIEQERMFNVIDNETIFKVDFIVAKQDPFAKQQFLRRKEMEVEAHKVWVISPEDLILAKLDWSRESLSEMQENDIKNIIRISGGTLDRLYLERWADRKGFKERLENLYAAV